MEMSEALAINRRQTLAVVLGASGWPRYPHFAATPACRESLAGIADYLRSSDGLRLDRRNVQTLIDSNDDAPQIIRQIRRFLNQRRRELDESGTPATDLLFFYCGHGGFAEKDRFFLSIRSTDEIDPLGTSITKESLARIVREGAAGLRTYLILDCCFAASAVDGFLSNPLNAAVLQLEEELPAQGDNGANMADGCLPTYGVAMLCASGPRDRARAPSGLPTTMFTGGFLAVLREGDRSAAEFFSLSDVCELVRVRLKAQFPDAAVLPELHCPQQRQGRLDLVSIFPNPARASGTHVKHIRSQPAPKTNPPLVLASKTELIFHKKIIYRIFLPSAAMILLYDSFGYYLSLTNSLTSFPWLARLLLTLGVATAIFGSMLNIAKKVALKSSSPGRPVQNWFLHSLLVIILGGYGSTVSSAFLLEGAHKVRETTERMLNSTIALQDASRANLSVKEFDDLKARVELEKGALHAEILDSSNGTSCGLGFKAKDIISAIQRDLPSVGLLRGTDQRQHCSLADRSRLPHIIIDIYDKLIDDALQQSPLQRQYRIAERAAFLQSLDDSANETRRELLALLSQLNGFWVFLNDFDLYKHSIDDLNKASDAYDKFFQEFSRLFGKDVPRSIAPHIDISSATAIGSISDFVTPGDSISTFIDILLSIILNGMAIYITSVTRSVEVLRDENFRCQGKTIDGTDVTYIFEFRRVRGSPRPT